MPTLSDLVTRHTALDSADLDWIHSLVSDWQLLADLSFADLILWIPHQNGEGWVAVAQMRPTTGPTVYHDDVVGMVVAKGERPLIDIAWNEHRICREGDPDWSSGVPVREETIPVRRGLTGRFLGVIQRSTNLSSARTPSRLELTYLQSASDLAQMVAEGRFPFPEEEPILVRSPRVGDGLLRLDRAGRVTYASPNALSAYRRLGLHADLVGADLGKTTADLCYSDEPINEDLMLVASGRAPRETEVEKGGTVVQLRAIPLIVGGGRIGALVLVRDVTELRRRERELLTKDATIREIHHRVKNNLQTVAALLRLQARRLNNPEGQEALSEAVRRVGSIAIVHEILAQMPEEMVEFDDIADRVIAMTAEVSVAQVLPKRIGSFGVLPAAVATPIAMVLTELLQNAVEHGFSHKSGNVQVMVSRDLDRLEVVVADDGKGLPTDFDLESTASLGLQIVRTLVVGELSGRLAVERRQGGGTEVILSIPVQTG
ncbi:PAS domain-containing sensor histidine kinase [Planotetraspora sp. A-T 1434]|uniref:PAS domain-containing sensor histidine kinase n=1 Tax=Planotetraspora sp. A-T 1434 TaxID=2979219 RepID=UPI0021BF9CF9|nr:PAS domain-containing sensor histidine kinase [Planotetraspora sp. A-T 1434]MCT9931246.1 PAS domain-containing sensor histidine kinase [Planotetraspora sp. A-T 1434]